jgi:hypothetical protein
VLLARLEPFACIRMTHARARTPRGVASEARRSGGGSRLVVDVCIPVKMTTLTPLPNSRNSVTLTTLTPMRVRH